MLPVRRSTREQSVLPLLSLDQRPRDVINIEFFHEGQRSETRRPKDKSSTKLKGCLLTRGEEGGSARKAKAHNLEVTGSL